MERNGVNPFKVGDVVVCIEPYGKRLIKDQEYVVKRIFQDRVGTIVEGDSAYWKNSRFTLKAAHIPVPPAMVPDDEAPVSLVTGDKVFIVARDEHFVESMERFVGDGKQYSVVHISESGSYLLSNDYYYLPSSLRLAVEAPQPGKAKKKKKKKAKRITKVNVRALIRKHVADGGTSGPCALGWEFEDNSHILSGYMACHAALGYTEQKKKVRTLVYALSHELKNCLPEGKPYRDAHKAYVKYVISQSPWAECFLTKDAGVAYRYDILMDISKPRNWIAGACITLREGSEFSGKLSMFKHLLKKKHNPHTAFLVSRYFSIDPNGKVNCSGMSGGHQSTVHSMNFEQLIKFFNEGYTRHADQEPFAKEHGGYSVFSSIADQKGASIGAWFDANVPKVIKGDGWGGITTYELADIDAAATKLDQLFTSKEVKA